MQTLIRNVEIVLDTHAIREILLDTSNEQLNKILDMIKKKCHTLVIPRLRSEHRVHLDLAQFLQLVNKFRTILRGKFIPDAEPEKRPPRELIESLREKGADKGDIIIASVAYRRARKTKRKALIVSDDKCFHQGTPFLRAYGIEVMYVTEFLKTIIE